MISIDIIKGDNIKRYAQYIASLRLMMFREFPYLYYGTLEHEEKYLSSYSDLPDGLLVLAKDHDLVIGLLTGMTVESFCAHFADFKTTLEKNNQTTQSAYYFGEYLVLPGYRGQGISAKLSHAMDVEIKKLGYKKAYQMTVIREKNHPCRPKKYKELDNLWEQLGWKKTTMIVSGEWPTVIPTGETQPQVNQLLLWEKVL